MVFGQKLESSTISFALMALHWPDLAEPYRQALHEAVDLVLARYAVWGIIASGSILRGAADSSSDLDIYVVHAQPVRQRLQRRFAGVPAEIFVNPPAQIRRYFAEERDRPSTAHMLATGCVVLDEHPVVAELQAEARTWLATPPNLSEAQLTWRRYMAADAYDNARDVADRDRATADLILHDAVRQMLEYAFLAANRHLPRVKAMLAALAELDPALGRLASDYYTATTSPARFALAAEIAQRTLHTTGFFAWESTPEEITA
jgi:hypothetical protein